LTLLHSLTDDGVLTFSMIVKVQDLKGKRGQPHILRVVSLPLGPPRLTVNAARRSATVCRMSTASTSSPLSSHSVCVTRLFADFATLEELTAVAAQPGKPVAINMRPDKLDLAVLRASNPRLGATPDVDSARPFTQRQCASAFNASADDVTP
jgi:hypothetical protein